MDCMEIMELAQYHDLSNNGEVEVGISAPASLLRLLSGVVRRKMLGWSNPREWRG